ncbi:MAG: EamA family transporter [Chitinivibrionales bacterium]|nr:EamA family transporter [Chitinivibrionales bacterium]MBD3358269.1 EamA family transporter [Chitinivibrionales bacterium]
MIKSYGAILITIGLFSTIEVVTKHIAGNVDIWFLAFIRFFAAGLCLLYIGRQNLGNIRQRDFLSMLAIAIIGVPLAFGAFHLSLRTINASTGAVIFSLNPVFSTIAAIFLVGERLSVRGIVGLILGFGGVYLVSFGPETVKMSEAVGPLLMFVSAVAFGTYITAAKRYVALYGPFTVMGLLFTTGSPLFLPFIDGTIYGGLFPTALWIAYLTFAATGLAYVLYFYGLSRLSITAGTSVFYLKPVIASLLARVILDEKLPPHFLVGLAIILGSLSLTRKNLPRFKGAENKTNS